MIMKIKNVALTVIAVLCSANALANSSVIVKTSSLNDVVLPSGTVVNSLTSKYSRITGSDEVFPALESALKDSNIDFDHDVEVKRLAPVSYSPFSPEVSSQSTADPLLSQQVSLTSDVNNMLAGIQQQRDVVADVDVLILDSGSLSHEDLTYSGGYSFTSINDAEPGFDYTDETIDSDGNVCSSGHGTEMASIIGAETGNGKGIAGISNANLYMGRVVATDCSTNEDIGLLSDVFDALDDVASTNSDSGIPTPDVINISLASQTPCPAYFQEAIDTLTDMGTVIVVSAGNQSGLSSSYAPANCNNVVVVGATDVEGEYSDFSNKGSGVDLAVIGTRLTATKDNEYRVVEGTSAASAAVSGAVALIKSSYPDLQTLEIEKMLKNTASSFSVNSTCIDDCGEGNVDFLSAINHVDKVADPVFEFSHALGEEEDCRVLREVEALSEHIDICNAYKSTVTTRYFGEDSDSLDYELKLLRKPVGTLNWDGDRVEVISEASQNSNLTQISILDVDTSDFVYAVASCDSGDCPVINEIDIDSLAKPSNCN